MEKDQKFFFETIYYSLITIRERLFLIIFLSFISLIISIFIHRNLNQEYEYKTTYFVNWSNYSFLPYYDDSKINKKDYVNFELKNYFSKNLENDNINIVNLDRIEVFYQDEKEFSKYEKVLSNFFLGLEIFLLRIAIDQNKEKQIIIKVL